MTQILSKKSAIKLIESSLATGNTILSKSNGVEKIQLRLFHIGLGRFHRGHQAFITDLLPPEDLMQWGFVSCSLRNAKAITDIKQQDNLFSVLETGEQTKKPRIVTSIRESILAPEQISTTLNWIASPKIKVITSTVTESGYHYNSIDNKVSLNENKEIAFDLTHEHKTNSADPKSSARPKTIYWYLYHGLEKRMGTSHRNDTLRLISCDNMDSNSSILKDCLIQFCHKKNNPALAEWIQEKVIPHDTMVDRIVPTLSASEFNQLQNDLHYQDSGAILTETFYQWVIKGKPCSDLPPWQKVGAKFTDDLESYKQLKLKVLNAAHTVLAYLGLLAGYEFVSQAVNDESILKFLHEIFKTEIKPNLNVGSEHNPDAYLATCIERFQNDKIKHRLSHIGCDGSLKIPIRFGHLRSDQPKKIMIFSAWLKCLQQKSEGVDRFLDIRDPSDAVQEFQKQVVAATIDTSTIEVIIQSIFGSQFLEKAPEGELDLLTSKIIENLDQLNGENHAWT